MNKLNQKNFVECASKLVVDTGVGLETIGLYAETETVAIRIYGDEDTGYDLRISEFSVRLGESWVETSPTDSQRASLAAKLSQAVLDVKNERYEALRKAKLQEQRFDELEKYGVEGAFYSSNH